MEQVYNCDETRLCFWMLPEKTLAGRAEKGAPGMKKQKEHVTLMACSNATGSHTLPLMFIGKAANPHCFKNVNKSALPVIYYAQKNAWVNAKIFSDWFHHHFLPAVKKHLTDRGLSVKALLLLDNAPAHPEATTLMSSDKSITAMFLPPNTTALIQPMDRGVLEAMKRICWVVVAKMEQVSRTLQLVIPCPLSRVMISRHVKCLFMTSIATLEMKT